MARRIGDRDHAAERHTEHDRLLDAERLAERAHVVAPLRQRPALASDRRRCGRCRDDRDRRPARRRRAPSRPACRSSDRSPGPPCSMISVGFSRMRGPSGTSFAPSTSKNSRTPLTMTCMDHALQNLRSGYSDRIAIALRARSVKNLSWRSRQSSRARPAWSAKRSARVSGQRERRTGARHQSQARRPVAPKTARNHPCGFFRSLPHRAAARRLRRLLLLSRRIVRRHGRGAIQAHDAGPHARRRAASGDGQSRHDLLLRHRQGDGLKRTGPHCLGARERRDRERADAAVSERLHVPARYG